MHHKAISYSTQQSASLNQGHSAVLTTANMISLNLILNLVHGNVWLVNDDPSQHMQSNPIITQPMGAPDIDNKAYYSQVLQ